MDSGFSKYFLSNMGVKQGCSLSPTLFGICIDKLEGVVNKVAREEGLNAPKLMQHVSYCFYMHMMWYSYHMVLIVCNIYLGY